MPQENDVSRRDVLKAAGAVAALPAIQGAPFLQTVKAAKPTGGNTA